MDEVVLTMYARLCNATDYVVDTVSYYVDLNYLNWLLWVFYPLVLTLLLPFVIFLFLYASALFLHMYRLRHLLQDAYTRSHLWDWARKFLAAVWDAQGNIWHGHEVIGLEKIPSHGPALLIYYHGALPVDLYYLVAKTLLLRDRRVMAVGDRFLFKIPGMKLMLTVFGVTPGTVSSGVQIMNDGHLLAIAPGGVREAFFSDSYNLVWGQRTGFAKIAVEAKVPVIPVFTQNCREAFRSLSWGREWFRKIYERTRLPIVPIYGMFPVKLKTHIGDPIPYDPDLSTEQLTEKVKDSLERLIARHQKLPGSIVRALFERIPWFDRPKQS